jgi:alpha-tubulin suppressor-like RCC1 family protein
MDEEAPLRFYGCGINSFFQLGPLVSECPSQSAGAATQASDDGSGAIVQAQNIHFTSQERKSVLHLPQPLALERYVAEEDGLVQDIACGATFTIALTSRGVPYQWGTINGARVLGGP